MPIVDPLLAFRPLFPILERTTYLVSNSLGAMPHGARDGLAAYADAWEAEGVKAWASRWWQMPIEVGDEIAPLIGAGAGEVAMLPTVTMAQAQVISALDYAPPRDTIVMTALDFPSVRYVYEGLARRMGARIVVVPTHDGTSIDLDELRAAIDERTRLVAISHVLFRSAWVLDVAAVCRRAREMGALVSLDAYHSVGVVPVDVKALDVDFLAGGVLKWLCGGPGGCFLYVRPETGAALEPALTGWQAHARPFGFEDEMEYAPGAWRWLGGTPVIPALYANAAGPRIVREAGMAHIREKSLRQTGRLIALADARGYRVNAPRDADRRGGTVALDVPHGHAVARCLLDRDVVIDYRPNAGIRIAPHFYTTDDELESAVAAIDDIIASGDWRRHEATQSVVT